MPAEAGIQETSENPWIPVFTGMTINKQSIRI